MISNLNSLQNTISDLQEIVERNQGANHETSVLVRQMEQLVVEIEQKARKRVMIGEVAGVAGIVPPAFA
jgi:hypothetical protein